MSNVLIETGTTSYTLNLDATGEPYYPCGCGETHRGDYTSYDYHQHTCLHDVDLCDLGHGMVICLDCGKTWNYE